MDYSALPHDPEHPGGADPWASSPQHNRTSFGQPPTSDIPSSPLPPQASPYGQNTDNYGYIGEQGAQNRPGTASESGDAPHAPPSAEQGAPQSPYNQQQAPAPDQQGTQRHDQPQRYHGNRQQAQRPQYKLSAKVTALERTGRKDPILRFDVYVRTILSPPLFHGLRIMSSLFPLLISLPRPTYPSSARRSSAMSAASILNS